MVGLLFTLALLVPYTILLFLYRYWWNKQETVKVPANFQPTSRFSILIPARNEATTITACLESIQQLNYPRHLFEVLVVDDFSEDATAATVTLFKEVRLLSLKEVLTQPINSYKKKAIETGIEQATGTYIVTTDADCQVPADWLRNFAWLLEQQPTVFIAAPVTLDEERTLLQVFQALDFLSLQGITGASVAAGFHSMCNGANLCYSKEAFYQVNGFKGVDHIASGDDLLLMHKLYQLAPSQVRYCYSPSSIVQTKPVATVKDFFAQRIRWASKATQYQDKRIVAVLVWVYFLNLFLLGLFVGGFWRHALWILLAAALFYKTVVELWFLLPVAAFFRKEKLLIWFPLAQPFHIVYTVIAGWLGKFGRYQWKGRRVK